MSIDAISSTNRQDNAFRNKILAAAGVGAAAGGIYAASGKRYLYDGVPSDTFVKKVSKNLDKEMSAKDSYEALKVRKFLEKVVEPEVDMNSLKPMIKDSKELSEAIKATPEEPVDEAITRVFSQPDKEKVKQDLISLQNKTKSDKIASENTALKLLHDNFDKKTKKLVKNEGTSDEVFSMIKKTAKKIQVKTVATVAVMTGAVAGALCLVASDVPGATNNKK